MRLSSHGEDRTLLQLSILNWSSLAIRTEACLGDLVNNPYWDMMSNSQYRTYFHRRWFGDDNNFNGDEVEYPNGSLEINGTGNNPLRKIREEIRELLLAKPEATQSCYSMSSWEIDN